MIKWMGEQVRDATKVLQCGFDSQKRTGAAAKSGATTRSNNRFYDSEGKSTYLCVVFRPLSEDLQSICLGDVLMIATLLNLRQRMLDNEVGGKKKNI